MLEVEVRGKIEGEFNKILSEFNKKAKFVKEKDRLSLIYFRSNVPDDLKDVREVSDDPVDLKLRITNKEAEIVLKYGKWGGQDNRKEIFVPINSNNFEDVAELLHLIGWSKGVIMDTKTFVFDYQGIEFALVKNENALYFEAEILVKNNAEIKEAKERLKKACNEFGLIIFNDEEMIKLMNSINNAPGRRFNLDKQSIEDIKNKYSAFF